MGRLPVKRKPMDHDPRERHLHSGVTAGETGTQLSRLEMNKIQQKFESTH